MKRPLKTHLAKLLALLGLYPTLTLLVSAAPGALDAAFNPSANGAVYSIAVQPDGKIVMGGQFSSVASALRTNVARVNSNGSADAAFNPGANDWVYCLAVQSDGKILLGGQFTVVGGVTRTNLARVDANGTLEIGFDPYPNGSIRCLVLQPDGKILIGGTFTSVAGVSRNRIARLNPDGTLDMNFNPNPSGNVNTIALQPDGKILVGGNLLNFVIRLNANGTVDTSFNAPSLTSGSFVSCFALQPDGKIIVGGQFGSLGNVTRNNMARLNSDGTLDPGFDPNVNTAVNSLGLQTDGKIVIAGTFIAVGSATRNRVARLNSDGTVDATFDPNSTGLTLVGGQADGKVLLCGDFFSIGTVPRARLARVENDTATQSLTVPNSSSIQWLRGGASPEATQVTYELSTDGGVTWTLLGAGTRITGGWQLTGLNLPNGGQIRGRARTTSGFANGSSGLIESVAAFSTCIPEIDVKGKSVTVLNGDSTPTGNDDTEFFDVGICGGSKTHTFTIYNHGACPLTITNIFSSNPSEFLIGPMSFPLVVQGGGSFQNFTVTFDPSISGNRNATITIANNSNSNPYSFSVSGNGIITNSQLLLTCPTNKVVSCGDLWSFDPPTFPSTAGGPGGQISVLSTVTNSLCPLMITRTWQAVDACGNTNACSQSVTVLDTVPVTLLVSAQADIFGAGQTSPPVFVGGGGVLPPSYSFQAGPGKVLRFPNISGTVTFTAPNNPLPFTGADGYGYIPAAPYLPTQINSYNGISGITNTNACFLVGVFLDPNSPASPAPPALDFGPSGLTTSFSSLSPVIGQTFFIGDGLTGTGSGLVQQFVVPPTATRLFLGFADGYNVQGAPSWYADNQGVLTVNFEISPQRFIAPINKTVSCIPGWNFDPPRLASGCTGTNDLTLTIVSTITNQTSPLVVTRIWRASDLCRNTNTFSQTVTVECPAMRTVKRRFLRF